MKLLALVPIILGVISVSQNIRYASIGATVFVAIMIVFASLLMWGIALSKKAIEERAARKTSQKETES